jgi:signal transduction histidine kinase
MQTRAIKNSVVISLVCLLTSVVLISRIISRPARVVRQLADFAHNLPTGHGKQLQVDRFSLETEQLGESLNYASREFERMRSSLMDEQTNLQRALKQRIQVEDDLRQFNIGLEQRVADEVERSREKDALLIQQARFAMLGETLMNISHQWRQPLNTIGLQVQEMVCLLKEGELFPEKAEQFSDSIMKQLVELSRTIDRFRKLNQSANLQASAIMPIKVIRETVDLVKSALNDKGISINLIATSETPLYCSPGELSQCLINIINNARDAIIERGVSDGRIDIAIDLNSVGKNRIRISNNGGQIQTDILERIFDPYVTSKFQSQGVGLGLFIVRQTIEKNMKGSIIARNTESGAEFVLEI